MNAQITETRAQITEWCTIRKGSKQVRKSAHGLGLFLFSIEAHILFMISSTCNSLHITVHCVICSLVPKPSQIPEKKTICLWVDKKKRGFRHTVQSDNVSHCIYKYFKQYIVHSVLQLTDHLSEIVVYRDFAQKVLLFERALKDSQRGFC